MSGISTIVTPEDRRERLRNLRDFHHQTFIDLGVPEALFIPKLAYKPQGKQEKHIGLFASEIARGLDIYTEQASADLVPEDPDRTLYKWRFNPNYKEEYETLENNGTVRYMIPVSELILIKSYTPETLEEDKYKPHTQAPQIQTVNKTPNVTDLPFSDLTIRDFAAIILKKPVSSKQWLNDLISK